MNGYMKLNFFNWCKYSTFPWIKAFGNSFIYVVYASNSNARPSLWPPCWTFFPSIRVDRVMVTPSRNFCWYPKPTWEELLTLARRDAFLSKVYLHPIPKLVSFFDAVHPRIRNMKWLGIFLLEEDIFIDQICPIRYILPKLIAVSRLGLTFWYTDPPNTWPSLTLVCRTKSPVE